MSAQHTPGPWQFYQTRHDSTDGLGYIRPSDEDGREIAHHGDTDRSREENEANGRLIAAAPAMLAKLQDIAEGCDACSGRGFRSSLVLSDAGALKPCPHCASVREVIAQATGATP